MQNNLYQNGIDDIADNREQVKEVITETGQRLKETGDKVYEARKSIEGNQNASSGIHSGGILQIHSW